MTKSWIGSRTNKFGSLLVAVGLAIATLPELRELLSQVPTEYQGYVALVIGVMVMILRHVTTGPVSTNVKATESENTIINTLNHAGFLESILKQNNVSVQEIKSNMEIIAEPWLRDIYTVWNVMETTRTMLED